MSMFTLVITCYHFQFTLIHGHNIPGSYAIFFFTASDFIFITSHIHNWALVSLWRHLFIFLELFLHPSPVVYWAFKDLGGYIFQCHIFLPFHICSWGSQGKNTEVVFHSLLQWTTFCQKAVGGHYWREE